MKPPVELDTVNRKILTILQAEGRLTYAEVGRRVGLSPAAVTERVAKLEDEGLLTGYRAEINIQRLGYSVQAYIKVFNEPPTFKSFESHARTLRHVLECHRVTGDASHLLRVVCEGVPELEVLLDDLMSYGRTETLLLMSSAVPNRQLDLFTGSDAN
ncbi:Lrp/AsnC family transcriptional regulator [Phytoactinopolyspora alkaliphila]|uniref:Lrp/AsnC family transcriptional regulator n=1 Tax=Phytoactinopolyspora alkaliphila TaxID=1783498 RepID=A0A6N9YNJ1_9ACTN|nr:Lrp/AsnC family transcriptional regulator [Phytoactinopolyspora alkaliphila]NED96517.1 Lrp/AsnC family transcriptional regulator [Phytoactinopolyspora alkaliphila]